MSMKGYSAQVVSEISEKIDIRLLNFYKDNVGKSKYYLDTFKNLLHTIIMEELKGETDPSVLSRLYSQKKRQANNKKKRMYRACESMIEDKIWEWDDVERYFAPTVLYNRRDLNTEQWNRLYQGKSFEEVQIDKLNIVKEWADDPKSLMIDYPGKEKKTIKQIYNNYKIDLTLAILAAMKELYNLNMDALTFNVMEDLQDKSMFSVTREQVKQTENLIGTSVIFTSEDGRRRTVITYDKEAFNGKDYLQVFDVKDSNILSYLLKIASRYSESATMPVMIERKKLVWAALENQDRKISGRDYDDLEDRLNKLSHATIDAYIDDIKVSTFHLIDAIEFPKDDKSYIAFWPSEYMKAQIENNKVSQLPATQRERLETNSAKLLYYLLLTQRVKVFRKMRSQNLPNDFFTVQFQYAHFIRYVNFGKGNQKENLDEIDRALNDYKSKGIFIHNFKYNIRNKTYLIEFLPLTDIEIQDLDYYFGNDYYGEIGQLNIFSFIE